MEHESLRRECAVALLEYLETRGFKITNYMAHYFPQTVWMLIYSNFMIDNIKTPFMSEEEEKRNNELFSRAVDASMEEFNSIALDWR